MTGLAASNSEGARKIREGAVHVDGVRVTDVGHVVTITRPTVVKLGRRYARLVPEGIGVLPAPALAVPRQGGCRGF